MLSRAPGPFRDSISFSIYAPPYSSAGRTVGVLQGADRLLRVMGSARNVASKLFEPAVVAAVHADELIVAFTGTANLSRIASDGSARPHWQLRTRRRPVSNGHIRDERDRRIREFEAATSRSGSNPLPFGGPPPETQRLRREAVENLESYTTFPEFRSILAGVDGVLWLEDYPLPGSDRVRWYRLENGVANAWVELSETAQVIAVAQDSFILLERDDFGLETAVIVRLQ
jgi:hypothetical protein